MCLCSVFLFSIFYSVFLCQFFLSSLKIAILQLIDYEFFFVVLYFKNLHFSNLFMAFFFCGLLLSSLLVACVQWACFFLVPHTNLHIHAYVYRRTCMHGSSICSVCFSWILRPPTAKQCMGKKNTQLSTHFKSNFYCVFFSLFHFIILFYWHISSSYWIYSLFFIFSSKTQFYSIELRRFSLTKIN